MRYLLDTNALLWFLANDKKLSQRARQLIESSSNESCLSIVSLWEIAIKTQSIGISVSLMFLVLIVKGF